MHRHTNTAWHYETELGVPMIWYRLTKLWFLSLYDRAGNVNYNAGVTVLV